jgi:uncharacterized protein (DUF2235 family)
MGRNVVVCCDGTWNEPDEERHGIPEPTNVSSWPSRSRPVTARGRS